MKKSLKDKMKKEKEEKERIVGQGKNKEITEHSCYFRACAGSEIIFYFESLVYSTG